MTRALVLFYTVAGVVVLAGAAWAVRRGAATLPQVAAAINPLNPNNVFASGANSAVQAVTGEPSLGGWLATVLNPDVAAADAAMARPVVFNDVAAGGAVDMGAGFGGDSFWTMLERAAGRVAVTPGGAVTGVIR